MAFKSRAYVNQYLRRCGFCGREIPRGNMYFRVYPMDESTELTKSGSYCNKACAARATAQFKGITRPMAARERR